MSRAFTKESDEDPNLDEIQPTLNALIRYLTRENNGVPVYERKNYVDSQDRTIHEMSNGYSYTIDACGKWSIIENS